MPPLPPRCRPRPVLAPASCRGRGSRRRSGRGQHGVAGVDEAVTFAALCSDGDPVEPGTAVAEVAGSARSILAAERTALNLLTHLSGVATATAAYVAAVAGTGCVVRDTRKTLPGMRALQKAAVTAGGGRTTASTWATALLVKDNHVAAAGGIAAATRAALAARRRSARSDRGRQAGAIARGAGRRRALGAAGQLRVAGDGRGGRAVPRRRR